MPFSDPKYPVVNPSPNVDNCIKSMRLSDYFKIIGITSGSWAFGYIFGKPVRLPTASTAAAIGITFAGMVALQDNRDRLMGYKENAKEVAKYGLAPDEFQPKVYSQVDPRFPVATGSASSNIRPPLKWNNYN